MNYLETLNIIKQYASHRALNDVSISVPQGSVYGLLGPNGAGKTTLIRIINRITAPDSGQVLFKGRPSKAEDVYNIGYLPEERGLYKKMKTMEQALFLAQLKGLSKAEAQKRINIWFEKFDIMSWKDKKVEELSKGMQQKVQFITSIIHNPDLLILDEPFSGFDPVNAALLIHEILELKSQGKTIILSTHNMESVESLCDEISLINQSKVVLQGTVNTIRQQHKENKFKLVLAHPTPILDAVSFTIISQEQQNNNCELIIQKQENYTNSQVLQSIVDHYEIIAFEEILPTMNEIFISTVKQ